MKPRLYLGETAFPENVANIHQLVHGGRLPIIHDLRKDLGNVRGVPLSNWTCTAQQPNCPQTPDDWPNAATRRRPH